MLNAPAYNNALDICETFAQSVQRLKDELPMAHANMNSRKQDVMHARHALFCETCKPIAAWGQALLRHEISELEKS